MRAILFVMALAVAGCAGCGGSQRPWHANARIAINGVAHARELADVVLAERYRAEQAQLTTSAQLDALDARYAPAETAVDIVDASLRTAEREVITARELGDTASKCRARAAVVRVGSDLAAAARELSALHVSVPAELPAATEAVAQAAATLFPGCDSSGGAQ